MKETTTSLKDVPNCLRILIQLHTKSTDNKR